MFMYNSYQRNKSEQWTGSLRSYKATGIIKSVSVIELRTYRWQAAESIQRAPCSGPASDPSVSDPGTQHSALGQLAPDASRSVRGSISVLCHRPGQ